MIVLRPVAATGRHFAFCTEIIRADGAPCFAPDAEQDGAVPCGGNRMNSNGSHAPSTASRGKRPGHARRRRIVSRLWQTAEKQVDEVENRLAALRDDPQAMEREAKTLAIIARTVRDLVAIDDEAGVSRLAEDRNESDNAAPARALAEFRRELAERLEQLRHERAGPGAP